MRTTRSAWGRRAISGSSHRAYALFPLYWVLRAPKAGLRFAHRPWFGIYPTVYFIYLMLRGAVLAPLETGGYAVPPEELAAEFLGLATAAHGAAPARAKSMSRECSRRVSSSLGQNARQVDS